MTAAEAASLRRAYIDLCWSVIPATTRKTPALDTWAQYQQTRASIKQMRAWWRLRPPAWAVVTGTVSRIVIIDADGDSALAYFRQWGLRPHVRTGSGGYHWYAQHPGYAVRTLNSRSDGALAARCPGVDVRADGGYAVFCGRNEAGEYRWLRNMGDIDSLDMLPAAAREWLIRPRVESSHGPHLVRERGIDADRPSIDSILRRAIAAVRPGSRNDTGFWLALQMRDNGYSLYDALAVGSHFVSACPDRDGSGRHAPYTLAQYRRSAESAFSRPAREPWVRRSA